MAKEKKTPPAINTKVDPEVDENVPEKESAETHSFKGLCINCENRFTCILPKPAGGVWHCEEYL